MANSKFAKGKFGGGKRRLVRVGEIGWVGVINAEKRRGAEGAEKWQIANR